MCITLTFRPPKGGRHIGVFPVGMYAACTFWMVRVASAAHFEPVAWSYTREVGRPQGVSWTDERFAALNCSLCQEFGRASIDAARQFVRTRVCDSGCEFLLPFRVLISSANRIAARNSRLPRALARSVHHVAHPTASGAKYFARGSVMALFSLGAATPPIRSAEPRSRTTRQRQSGASLTGLAFCCYGRLYPAMSKGNSSKPRQKSISTESFELPWNAGQSR
jgi:hypothetical protein